MYFRALVQKYGAGVMAGYEPEYEEEEVANLGSILDRIVQANVTDKIPK